MLADGTGAVIVIGLTTFTSDNGDHESGRQGLQTQLAAERGGIGSPRNFHVNVPLKFNLLRHSNTRQVFASSHRAPWWPQLQPLPLALNTASSSAHVPSLGLNSNFFVVLCFSAINSLQGQPCFRVRTDEFNVLLFYFSEICALFIGPAKLKGYCKLLVVCEAPPHVRTPQMYRRL